VSVYVKSNCPSFMSYAGGVLDDDCITLTKYGHRCLPYSPRDSEVDPWPLHLSPPLCSNILTPLSWCVSPVAF
jgi:hypothetical protein